MSALSDTTTGATDARYRRRKFRLRTPNLSLTIGLTIAGLLLVLSVVVLTFGNVEPARPDIMNRLAKPGSPGSILGTDGLGRDVFARTLAGLWWTASVGLVSSLIVMTLGTAFGLVAGVHDGIIRSLVVRTIDMALAFPFLVLAVVIMAVIGRGFWPMSLTLGLVSWPLVARVVYAEAMGVMKRDYILASRLIGDSKLRMVFIHVLPGIKNSLLVVGAFIFADLVVAESGLSFLGIGVPLGEPSVGSMLADGREYMATAPHMLWVPGITIVLMVVSANLIGDGLSSRTRTIDTALEGDNSA